MEFSRDIKDWIMLTLTNVNTSAASVVDIFKLPANANTSATLGGQAVFSLPISEFPKPFLVTLTDPTPVVLNITATDINDLVSQIQTYLDANGGGQVFYLEPTAGSYNIYFYSPIYTLVSIKGTAIYTAVALNQTVINGSTVNVEVSTSSLTYNELVSELNYQAYLLDYVNVYANDINQINSSFTINNTEPNGHADVDLRVISLSPIAKQYAKENLQLDFTPRATNTLSYTVGAGEQVKMIFSYTHKDLLKLPTKTLFVPKKELPDLNKVILQQRDLVPMIKLVNDHVLSDGGKIKKVLQKYVEPSKVNVQEVISAFDFTDFREL